MTHVMFEAGPHRGSGLWRATWMLEILLSDLVYKNPQRSPGDAAAALGPGTQDMVAVHMLRLYEKYSRRGARPGGGNTVRSFRARLGK